MAGTISAFEMTMASVCCVSIGLVIPLAKTNEIYYLNPSYGYYFEQFYQEPHGLVYKLKTLPGDTLLPPLPDKKLIAGNEAFWSRLETQAIAPIQRAVTPPDPNAPKGLGERLLAHFTCRVNITKCHHCRNLLLALFEFLGRAVAARQ